MNMKEQKKKWFEQQKKAKKKPTLEEAWEAGYYQSTENWVKRER